MGSQDSDLLALGLRLKWDWPQAVDCQHRSHLSASPGCKQNSCLHCKPQLQHLEKILSPTKKASLFPEQSGAKASQGPWLDATTEAPVAFSGPSVLCVAAWPPSLCQSVAMFSFSLCLPDTQDDSQCLFLHCTGLSLAAKKVPCVMRAKVTWQWAASQQGWSTLLETGQWLGEGWSRWRDSGCADRVVGLDRPVNLLECPAMF